VHVWLDSGKARIWLDPEVHVASSDGFDAPTLREMVRVAESNRELVEQAWNEPFR